MIKLTVRQAARKRGIKKPQYLAQRLDNTTGRPSAKSTMLAGRLWRGKPLPKLENLEKVAYALECDLWELLLWKPDKRKKLPPPNGSRSNGRL